jgi:hypothetical protein
MLRQWFKPNVVFVKHGEPTWGSPAILSSFSSPLHRQSPRHFRLRQYRCRYLLRTRRNSISRCNQYSIGNVTGMATVVMDGMAVIADTGITGMDTAATPTAGGIRLRHSAPVL